MSVESIKDLEILNGANVNFIPHINMLVNKA